MPGYIGGIGPWCCFAHSWNIPNGLWQTEWCGIEGNPREIPGRPSPAETQLQTHPARELETHEARHHVNSCCGTSKPSFFKGFVMARLPPLDQISLTTNSCPLFHKHQGRWAPLSPFALHVWFPPAWHLCIFLQGYKYGAIEGILRSNTSTRAVLCFEVFEVTLKYRVRKGDQHPPPRFLWQMPLPSLGPTELGTCLLMVHFRTQNHLMDGWSVKQPAGRCVKQPASWTHLMEGL